MTTENLIIRLNGQYHSTVPASSNGAVLTGLPDGDHIITVTPVTSTGVEGNPSIPALATIDKSPMSNNVIIPHSKSFGERENITPLRYYKDGTNELAEPTAHPHIMGFTHKIVKSGRWSDPTVWDVGTIPGSGAVVSLKEGCETIYDVESDNILKDIYGPLGSTFRVDGSKDTRLRADFIMFMGSCEMVVPQYSDVVGKPRHEIVFHASQAPLSTTRLGIVCMGPTRIRGVKKKGHLRASKLSGQIETSIPAGSETITLTNLSSSGWRVGDTIIVLGTSYTTTTTNSFMKGPSSYWLNGKNRIENRNLFVVSQDEERIITEINGNVITLNEPLLFNHTGMIGTLKDGKQIDVRPVVANVSRSIRFRSASAEEDGLLDPNADITDLQKRAHSMFMRHPNVDARYFETKNMGRTSTDPTLMVDGLPYAASQAGGTTTVHPLRTVKDGPFIFNENNVRGRYCVHLHWCGGPYRSAPKVNIIGVSCWAPIGGHPLPGWAMTHHGTRAAIEDCVISNGTGAGMVSELGHEIGHWVSNVVTGIRGEGDNDFWGSRTELYPNHNGSHGVAYDNQSRAIIMQDNIAGACKIAYGWHSQKDNAISRSPRDVDLPWMDGVSKNSIFHTENYEDEDYGAISVQIPPFLRNEAMACIVGFEITHRQGDTRHLDKTPLLIEEFHCLNVSTPWSVPEYSNSYYTKDCLWQGPVGNNKDAVIMGNVTWDWSFSNIHLRNYITAFKDTGAGLNYEGFIVDVTTENVTHFSSSDYRTVAGLNSHAIRNVMGDWIVNPNDPDNSAIIRKYRSLDSATELPQPYPLEPYGRKLPANKPNGDPYPLVLPGDDPYFVLGDGTNGEASTVPVAINLTLVGGNGRGQGRFYGILRDSLGDRRWPDYQSSESFPNNTSIKTHRTLKQLTPEQLVQRWGCWQDGSTWKVRTWYFAADRFTHRKITFHIDFTLTNMDPDFLQLHNMGGPSTAPQWPDKPELVTSYQTPLVPETKSLTFLNRKKIEVVSGSQINHQFIVNSVSKKLEIFGGDDASHFTLSMGKLIWNGTNKTLANPQDFNGDNIYEVIIKATDHWGNTVEELHRVQVVTDDRFTPVLTDNFNRADEFLEANPNYIKVYGDEGAMRIVSNRVYVNTTKPAFYHLGNIGSSEQEVDVFFTNFYAGRLCLRVEDENNWIGFTRNDAMNATVIEMCKNGTITRLARVGNMHNLTIRLVDDTVVVLLKGVSGVGPVPLYPRVVGDVIKILDYDPRMAAGALKLPEDAPKGTGIALQTSVSGSNIQWLDSLSARSLSEPTPNKIAGPITFNSVNNATPSTVYESNEITITNVQVPVPIWIGGANGHFSINGGAYSNAQATMVSSGDNIKVRLTSSATSGTTLATELLVGSKTKGIFTVTTS